MAKCTTVSTRTKVMLKRAMHMIRITTINMARNEPFRCAGSVGA